MKRRLIQLCAALLYNLNLKGFAEASIYKGKSKGLCVPGLNCYSCPGAVGSCPLGTLQNALSAMDRKLPFYILGVLLLFGVTMGRTICGFLCPFGLVQELLYRIPVPKIKKNRVTQELSKVKYVILAVLSLYCRWYLRQPPAFLFLPFVSTYVPRGHWREEFPWCFWTIP